MVRREVAFRLMAAGFTADMLGSPDTMWHHPKGKCLVMIRYGGSVCIWYNQHPVHLIWDGQRFYDKQGGNYGKSKVQETMEDTIRQ